MSNYPTRIDLVFPTTPPPPLPPAHSYYEPTEGFIARHSLHINEAEVWVEINDTGDYRTATKSIDYNKGTGETRLYRYTKSSHVHNEPPHSTMVFVGYLPDEAALESVITYTNW